MSHVPVGGRIPRHWLIKMQVSYNPKQPESDAYARFWLYIDGMRVGAFLDAGGTMGDVRHNIGHGFLCVYEPGTLPVPHAPVGGKIPRHWLIKMQVSHNPKQPGKKAYARFRLYLDGMTVGAFLDAGGTMSDVRHNIGHGYLRVREP